MLVYQSYTSDLGRIYPVYLVAITTTNGVSTQFSPLELLKPEVREKITERISSCVVPGLTARKLALVAVDGARFELNYPVPFDEDLAEYLTGNLQIQAWEFIGERIKYSRLRRMLDNVQSSV